MGRQATAEATPARHDSDPPEPAGPASPPDVPPRTAARAGELARLTAACLASAGLAVTRPGPADDPGPIVIARPDARCALSVSDTADAELEWAPRPGRPADPRRVAELAAALLSGPAPASRPPCPGTTFKGIAGTSLRAAGFGVQLNAYPDDATLNVTADISVTNPARNAGTAYITDDGGLTWQRDYHRDQHPDPAAAARAIAAHIAQALGHGQPAAPRRPAGQAAP